tara:strand:+ start:926 stop:1987 length:1062 start_codon:yes stop_codon:yes gene_type:complete
MKKNIKTFVPIDKFIKKSLYEKDFGYYMTKNPFGKKGDFITSPNISVVFSEIITIWIILYWRNLGSPKKFDLIELGAGNAEMILQIIKSTKNFKSFNESVNFYIFEKSPILKKIQKKKLRNHNVKWINNLQKLKKNNCLFIGNEFLDAFPIKQFEKKEGVWYEKYIETLNIKKSIKNKKVNIKYFEKLAGFKFSNNQSFVEISFDLIKFLNLICAYLKQCKGGVLFIDYGLNDNKMYNTLQAVKKHKPIDYLQSKGDLDITYLVNFDMISKILQKNKLKINGFVTQGSFLKEMGILERAEIIGKKMSFLNKSDLYYRINRLIDKKQMGKLFKVIFASNISTKFQTGFSNSEID